MRTMSYKLAASILAFSLGIYAVSIYIMQYRFLPMSIMVDLCCLNALCLIAFLTGIVMFIGAAIGDCVERLTKRFSKQRQEPVVSNAGEYIWPPAPRVS